MSIKIHKFGESLASLLNLLGIDFEEWFHIELIQRHLPSSAGITRLRVIDSIDQILDWLRKNDTYATFFMVGELLRLRPELLDKIDSGGHEIAFHTMHHTRLDSPLNSKEIFDSEVKEFDALTSGKSKGFRAPSFSLSPETSWAIDVLDENNYLYDSSIVPAKTRLYGVPRAETVPYKITSKAIEKNEPNGKIIEFPLLTTRVLKRSIPSAGGFYLRLLPMRWIENAISAANNRNAPAAFYIHSWELAPEFMPKVPLPWQDHFITYHNIGKVLSKMTHLVKKFDFTSFSRFIHDSAEYKWKRK